MALNVIRKIAITANIIEWYDYVIFMFVADQIATNFFPAHAPLGLIKTLGIFFISYLCRPIGAIVLGRLAKDYGLRKTIMLSMFLTSLPVLFISFLPGYYVFGVYAPLILLICRIVQGVGMGAEYPLSSVYVFNMSSENQRIFNSGLISVSVSLGMVIAAITTAVLNKILSHDQMYFWGWRLALLLSIPGTIYLFKLRIDILQTQPKSNVLERDVSKNTCSQYGTNKIFITAILCCLFVGFNQAVFYTAVMYMPSYLTHYLHFESTQVYLQNIVPMVVMMLTCFVFSIFAQRKGIFLTQLISAVSCIVFVIPLFQMILSLQGTESNFHVILLLIQSVLAILSVGYGVTNMPFLNTLFLFHEKSALLVCITYTCGAGLISGPSLLVVDYCMRNFQVLLAPAYLCITYSIGALLLLLAIRKRCKEQLNV